MFLLFYFYKKILYNNNVRKGQKKVMAMRMCDYPRSDTLRAKKKIGRKVKSTVRRINRGLREDVFGDRFWIEVIDRQIKPWSDNSGWQAYFRIKFHDRENPERDFDGWYDLNSVIYSGFFAGGQHMDSDLNNFICESDFWNKYRASQKESEI